MAKLGASIIYGPLNISGQITSSLATGTAPFSIASTTMVNNLNVQYLNGQLGTYYYPASNPNSYSSTTGTVTSVGGTGTISGLTLTGTVTGSGNLTLGGTLAVATSSITGITTIGTNGLKIADIASISFARYNADETISMLSASDFRTAIGAGTSSTTGTVTSVAAGTHMNFTTFTTSGTITHSTTDGSLHVPATSTTSNGKVLIAGATAGAFS